MCQKKGDSGKASGQKFMENPQRIDIQCRFSMEFQILEKRIGNLASYCARHGDKHGPAERLGHEP